MSIKVSPKYGINPTVPICFWCGKQKNEIALLGKLKGDVEAPHNCILDYEPCEECQKNMDLGVTLIGCVKNQPKDKRIPIIDTEKETLYPTGSWIVVTKDAAKRYFKSVATEEEIEKAEKILVEQEFINFLNDQMKQLEEDN